MTPLQFLDDDFDFLKGGKFFFTIKCKKFLRAEGVRFKRLYLPKIYRTPEFDGKFFIVEEFIKGQKLLDFLTYNKGLDEKVCANA